MVLYGRVDTRKNRIFEYFHCVTFEPLTKRLKKICENFLNFV